MPRYLQKKQMTHPLVRDAQSGFGIKKHSHEDVCMQVALHHNVGLAIAHQSDRQARRVDIPSTVVQARLVEFEPYGRSQWFDLRPGPYQVRFSQPFFHCPTHGHQHDLLRGIGDRDPSGTFRARTVNESGKCPGCVVPCHHDASFRPDAHSVQSRAT